jgi:8-oxo-dGTP pyrophosphatase MutT (NUDIX family)
VSSTIDKLAWICIKERQLLATRTKGKEILYLPGGKREVGESDEAALIREINEELTVDLVPTSIRHARTFEAPAHGRPAGTMVRMTCYRADFMGDLTPAAEINARYWIQQHDAFRCSEAVRQVLDWLTTEGLVD